jgi:hypothetical protein
VTGQTAPETPHDAAAAPNSPDLALGDTPTENGPQTGAQARDHRHPQCPKCLTIWHQAGNRTGHCRACCLTFDSLAAFDRHRRDGECLYPGDIRDTDGRRVFERREVDLWSGTLDAGTSYWRLALTDQQAERFDRLAAERTAIADHAEVTA